MSHNCRITLLVLEAQRRVFRLAERNHGLKLKTISLDSGIPYNTVRSYASGEAVMPLPALLKLTDAIPDYLLSYLLEPVGKAVVDCGSDDGDHDTLADNCIDFLTRKGRAHHPESEAGVNIGPREDRDLRACRQQLRSRA